MLITAGGLATALVAIAGAWTTFDLPVGATRSWTLAQIERLERIQREQSGVLYDIRRGQVEKNIIELEAKRRRAADDELRLRAMKEDLRRLDTQRDRLEK